MTWPTIVKPPTPQNVQCAFRLAGAPEADLAVLEPGVDLRQQLDLDSMDILNIPEADYSRFVTLNGGIEYLAQRASVVRKG